MIPTATYRLQFHAGFGFADAEAIVPYLHDLGISHVYASPITAARPGSSHGYDVIDPTRINPELGGEEGFVRLAEALRDRGMGLILDIVPNHMAAHADNRWWTDVLARGPDSEFARFFDIDWTRGGGRMLMPFLGAPLDEAISAGDVRLVEQDGEVRLAVYGEQFYPLRAEGRPQPGALGAFDPGTEEGRRALARLLDAQHYRLAWWRTGHDALNWRRFFSITELTGVRVEDEAVFEATHALFFRLYRERRIDGLRIDHVDGLADPAAYLARLRERLDALDAERDDGGRAWLVVEKILGPGEPIPEGWPIDGTTGYEFMDQVSALLHDPAGARPLAEHWATVSGRPADFGPEERRARRQMLAWQFGGQREACIDAFAALAADNAATRRFTRGMIARAVDALLFVFPVYRTYGTGEDAPPSDARTRRIARERAREEAAPGEIEVIDAILAWLAGEGAGDAAEAVRRFQQLSAPIAAKAVEDTAFYRYGRLLSRTDVGFDPEVFALEPDAFHAAQAERAERFPASMLTTATHDHKRGEDIRARLAVLSEIPGEWIAAAERWRTAAADIEPGADPADPADVEMLLQTLVGAWPEGLAPDDRGGLDAFAERVTAWQQKALREAKLRSSWAAPDGDYEARLDRLARALLDPGRGLTGEIAAFVGRIEPAARANGLVQAALRCTAPGVPDLYQGCELRDFSLVDPDNRRPVDYAERTRRLEAGVDRKQATIRALLALRRAFPEPFGGGSYVPLTVEGPDAGNLLAFAREGGGQAVLCVMRLRCAGVENGDWEGQRATIALSPLLARAAGAEKIAVSDMAERFAVADEALGRFPLFVAAVG